VSPRHSPLSSAFQPVSHRCCAPSCFHSPATACTRKPVSPHHSAQLRSNPSLNSAFQQCAARRLVFTHSSPLSSVAFQPVSHSVLCADFSSTHPPQRAHCLAFTLTHLCRIAVCTVSSLVPSHREQRYVFSLAQRAPFLTEGTVLSSLLHACVKQLTQPSRSSCSAAPLATTTHSPHNPHHVRRAVLLLHSCAAHDNPHHMRISTNVLNFARLRHTPLTLHHPMHTRARRLHPTAASTHPCSLTRTCCCARAGRAVRRRSWQRRRRRLRVRRARRSRGSSTARMKRTPVPTQRKPHHTTHTPTPKHTHSHNSLADTSAFTCCCTQSTRRAHLS
jgi:hypothetical protein